MTMQDRAGSGMIGRMRAMMASDGMKGRTLRSAGWIVSQMVSGRGLRLISNLILTRLLFPEAFGMMAIVNVFMTGLEMFSTTGVNQSIMQNKRGDDPEFLDTAWTIKVIRGLLLWLGTCALAVPVAAFYDEPMLAWLLPVAGVTALIEGLLPTKVITASRHLKIGRISAIGIGLQVVTIPVVIFLAWSLQSVWALVLGPLVNQVLRQIAMRYFLPGRNNRFLWNPSAASELFHFGKYIFLSTVFGFIVNHADRLIIGAFIPIGTLGIYSVATIFAALTFSVAQSLTNQLLMPIYRMRPISESESNRRHIFAVRRGLIALGLAGNALFAYGGVFLIETLYDSRYHMAGPMLVLLCLVYVPRIVFVGAGVMMLSQGDSKRFMYYTALLAALQTAFMLLGAWQFGIVGAIVAPAFGILASSPLRIVYARRYEAWDALGETGLLVLGLSSGLFACWLHLDEILTLFQA